MRRDVVKPLGLIGVLLVLVFSGLFAGCRGKGSGGEKEAARPHVTGVAVEAAALSQADEYIETSGTVKMSKNEISIIAAPNIKTLLTPASIEVRMASTVFLKSSFPFPCTLSNVASSSFIALGDKSAFGSPRAVIVFASAN